MEFQYNIQCNMISYTFTSRKLMHILKKILIEVLN